MIFSPVSKPATNKKSFTYVVVSTPHLRWVQVYARYSTTDTPYFTFSLNVFGNRA